MIPENDSSLPIGEKIKRLREGACLSLEQLAERSGLDVDELRRIEDDLMSPALGVLMRVCQGLGVRLQRFFDAGPRKFYSLYRAGDQKVSARFASKSGADYGYVYQPLGAEKRERAMEPFLITITPPSDPTGKPLEVEGLSQHAGEEYLYVLEGQIEVQLQDEHMVLGPGDSLYYDASMPHRVLHRGPHTARVLAVIHMPRVG